MLYFDHNATSPLSIAARDAWLDAVARFIGNPSSPHRLGARAETALEGARETLARRLECESSAIVWTSGATESNNTVVQHFARGEGEAWVSAIEHPCVLASVKLGFPGRHRLMPVHASGVVDLDWLRDALKTQSPAFVGLMAANNETGVLQPWREALSLCREAGVPFFCDAAQWIGKLPASGLGACDFLSGLRAQIRRAAGRRLPEMSGPDYAAALRREAGGGTARRDGERRGRARDDGCL